MWYFGNGMGLDFSSGMPMNISGGQTGTENTQIPQEGTACIADSAGNILFYTGGQTIWNRNHTIMPNGSNLFGGTSSTQSSIIVPLPGNENLFYVFTGDEFQSYLSPPQNGYCYSIVDMCLEGGNGDISPGQKNILLLDSATEKLAVCEDNMGTGYWVIGHKMFSREFRAWHLTSAGISNTVISIIGTIHGKNGLTWTTGAALGQMKINATGTKLALAIGNNDPAIVDLFDFNSTTGSLSNYCRIVIDSVLGKRIYGVEFSPDGSKLYATGAGGSGGKRIYQYNVTAGSCNAVIASRAIIYQSNTNSVMNGLQLGPDNKIYGVCNSYYDLSRINFPNLTGAAAGFDSSAIALSGAINNYTLPSFIAGYKYKNTVPNCSTSAISSRFSEACVCTSTCRSRDNRATRSNNSRVQLTAKRGAKQA